MREDNKDHPMSFRPAEDLRRMIKEAAQRAHRSLSGEIAYRLDQSFAAERTAQS